MPLSSDQMDLLRLIMRIFGSISVFLNLSLIACVVVLERFHKPISYLQANLAGLEIIQASIYIIGNEIAETSPTTCLCVGIAAQFFFNSVTFMNFNISLYVYLSIIYRLAFVMEAVHKRGAVFGDSTFECWISEEYAELRIDLFYLPLWINSAFIFAIYSRILWFLRSHRETKNDENIQTGVIPAAPETTSLIEDSNQLIQDKTNVRAMSFCSPGSNVSSLSRKPFIVPSLPAPIVVRVPSLARSHKTGKSGFSTGNKLLLIKAGVTAAGFIISWLPASAGRMHTLITAIPAPYWLTVLTAIGLSTFGLWNPGIFFLTWLWPSLSKKCGTRASVPNEVMPDYPVNACGGKNYGV
ncbi:hypothetical protein BJ741DRAFT_715176 [Chytriomyces cf. hyalinus JEL632]|nr:hypothetical protein BJ741DRAFT_715176 [Chytriomyces cf. hyalinus JEL632]